MTADHIAEHLATIPFVRCCGVVLKGPRLELTGEPLEGWAACARQHESMREAIALAHRQGAHLVILSDANAFFINSVLKVQTMRPEPPPTGARSAGR